MSEQQLRECVRAGDFESCVGLLRDLDGPRRAALRAAAKQLHHDVHQGEWEGGSWRPTSTAEQRRTAVIAVWGTATLQDFLESTWAIPDDDQEPFLDALRVLRPRWRSRAAAALVDVSPHRWWMAHLLVKEGLSDKPEGEAWILGMMGDGVLRNRKGDLRELLVEDDPSLLEDEVWRLFEVEGGGEFSLAAFDKFRGTWAPTLIGLAAEGILSRDRLLDASLDALERDFAQFRAGWHSRFHEQLEPTLEERAARQARYRRLLGSAVPPTVTFALKALGVLDKGKRLQHEGLLDALEPALTARAKSNVKRALKLVASVVESSKGTAERAAVIAATALVHEAGDVQAKALDLIDALVSPPSPEVAAAIAPFADGVQPSLQARLVRWLGNESTTESVTPVSTGAVGEVPARLDESRRVLPIADVDELVARLSYVLEHPGDVIEIERVLDGVSRFAASPELTRPLVKRATKIAEDQMDGLVRLELARLALSWCSGKAIAAKRWGREKPLQMAMQDRFDAILARSCRGELRPLLSLPTHRGGWLDPAALVARATADAGTDIHDQVIALLRLAPEGREGALAAAEHVEGELGDALRHALGAKGTRVGETTALWLAAARARAPFDDDPAVLAAHPGHGPDAAEAGRYTWRVRPKAERKLTIPALDLDTSPEPPKDVPSSHLAVLLGSQPVAEVGGVEGTMSYEALLWPARRDGLFAGGVQPLYGNLDWYTSYWNNRLVLEPLCDPHCAMTDMALLVLAIGLGAKEPGERGLAVDAFVAARSEGRLDPAALGGVMAALLHGGDIKAARWASSLGDVAASSSRDAEAVVVALLASLRGDPDALPRDIGTLFGLLRELLTARAEPIADEEARAYLSRVTRGGKAGKLAKLLVKQLG